MPVTALLDLDFHRPSSHACCHGIMCCISTPSMRITSGGYLAAPHQMVLCRFLPMMAWTRCPYPHSAASC